MHSWNVTAACSVSQIQYTILHHLVCGDCFCCAALNLSCPCGSRIDIVCGQLSSPFPSATDMSLALVRRVVDDILIDQQLPIWKLAALASAFVNNTYTSDPFSTPCVNRMFLQNQRRDMPVQDNADVSRTQKEVFLLLEWSWWWGRPVANQHVRDKSQLGDWWNMLK